MEAEKQIQKTEEEKNIFFLYKPYTILYAVKIIYIQHFTLYTLHFTLYTFHCTLYAVQFTLCQCKVRHQVIDWFHIKSVDMSMDEGWG